jgi:hypothetical protein
MFHEILKKWTHLRLAYKGWRFLKMCEDIGFALLHTMSIACHLVSYALPNIVLLEVI